MVSVTQSVPKNTCITSRPSPPSHHPPREEVHLLATSFTPRPIAAAAVLGNVSRHTGSMLLPCTHNHPFVFPFVSRPGYVWAVKDPFNLGACPAGEDHCHCDAWTKKSLKILERPNMCLTTSFSREWPEPPPPEHAVPQLFIPVLPN